MARLIKEWRGKNDGTPVPPRVKLRIIARYGEHCPKCGRQLRAGHTEFDHIRALINGGANSEFNIEPLCDVPCHKAKTRADVAIKSKTYKRRAAHLGIKRKRSSFATNRDGIWKKKMDGTVVRRERAQTTG